MEDNIFKTKPKIDENYITNYVNHQLSKLKIRVIDKNEEVLIEDQVLLVKTTESDVILNLPNTRLYDGKFYYVKNLKNESLNFITINGNGILVENDLSYVMNVNILSLKVIYSEQLNSWICL
jgi:hypothetical protein